MNEIKVIGIDLAKSVFQVCVWMSDGNIASNRKVSRAKLLDTIRQFPPGSMIAMEACTTSHYWGRTFQSIGFSIKQLCDVFSVHRSSYQYWRQRSKIPSAEQTRLRALVREAHESSHGSAGARTIADIVSKSKQVPLTCYRATKLMKSLGLVSRQTPKHRYKKVTQEHVEIPNHLGRQFAVTEPDQVWVGDVAFTR